MVVAWFETVEYGLATLKRLNDDKRGQMKFNKSERGKKRKEVDKGKKREKNRKRKAERMS